MVRVLLAKITKSKNRNIHVIVDSSLFYLIFSSFFDSMYSKKYGLFEVNKQLETDTLCSICFICISRIYAYMRVIRNEASR